jgi:threonine dehydrogenase-like Zn-dependent dehydrogenase
MVSYPRIPGHEVSGTIVAVGAEVPAEWRPGLAVTLSPYTCCGRCPSCRAARYHCCRDNQTLGVQREGALTELLVVPWQKLFTSPRLGLRELVLVEPFTVGGHAVARGRVSAADTVCVLGCGAIGLGAIAGAACRGARVIAVDIDDAKLALARQAGAAETINSATANLHDRLHALTSGDGPAVVIEAIGLPQTFRAAVTEVAFAGRVVYIGYAKQPVEYETKYFVQKELDILGSRNATPDDFRQVIAMLEAGRVPVAAMISRTAPFTAADEALAAWHANPAAFTKILIELGA